MKYTNKKNLPLSIYKAVKNDDYDNESSDYTATSLIDPPRLRELVRTKVESIDVSDCIDSLKGQAMHTVLERAVMQEEGYIVEKRFKKVYKVNGKDFVVSAKVDLFDPGEAKLSDYKTTSVASSKRAPKEEHIFQMSVQAELVRHNGFQVEEAEVVLLLDDWTAMREYAGYPVSAIMTVPVPLMSSEETDAWIVGRIKLHEAAKGSLPKCSDKDKWAEPTFAVMKPGAVKATRVMDSAKAAELYIIENNLDAKIVERPGNPTRCQKYCPARFVCDQAKEEAPEPELDEDGFIKITKS